MDNINKYLKWRGDIPFSSKYGFNEIDSMILARFSYLPFDKINIKESESLQEISKRMIKLDDKEFIYNGDKELITNLGSSERFKNIVVTDFESVNDIETEKQFGAITVHLSEKEMYVSYVGTDFSINGWKEDFNMAFMEAVPCQVLGKEYLEKIASKYPDKKIRIGGHSKGGNVAIYSYVMASKEVQAKVIKVYNYDGPGFNKYMLKNVKIRKNALNKIQTYIPQESIIGRMLKHNEKCKIVKSNNKGLLQHDIFSWEVLKDDVITIDELTDSSEIINETLTEWLENINSEKRKMFVDIVFDLLYSTENLYFEDISKSLPSSIIKILKSYKNVSDEEKKIFTDMIKLFILTYFETLKEKEGSKLEAKKSEYIERGKEKIKKIDIKLKNKKRKKV